jgi:aconitate hydratase
LKDIWPSKDEVKDTVNKFINSEMFTKNYEKIAKGTKRWNELEVSKNQ